MFHYSSQEGQSIDEVEATEENAKRKARSPFIRALGILRDARGVSNLPVIK
jgi:hypothetical protein